MRCDEMIRQKWMTWDEMRRIAMKATYYSVNILLVFQNVFLVSNDTIQAWNSVYQKTLNFSKLVDWIYTKMPEINVK